MIDTKMNNTLRMLLAIVAIGSTGLAVSAQAVGTAPTVNLRLESARTKKRLAEIVAKIQKNQHDDAVAELQAILDEASGDLIEIDGSPTLVPARTVARTLLVSLPPAVRERLRERMESVARSEIAEARKRNDLPALQRLIDRYFLTRAARDALRDLGDMLFERGKFRAAESAWLALTPSIDPAVLKHPEPHPDQVGLQARLCLAAMEQGDPDIARQRLVAFNRDFLGAEGTIAGRTGKLSQILADRMPANGAIAAAMSPVGSWTQLGGNDGRTGQADSRMPKYWPSAPTWRTAIPLAGDEFSGGAAGSTPKSSPYHPVIAAGRAYLADAVRILSFDLANGAARVEFDLRDELRNLLLNFDELRTPPRQDADISLAIDGDRLYARLGNLPLWPNSGRAARPVSLLMSFSIQPDGKLKKAWSRPPVHTEASWDGAPAVADGRIVATSVRVESGRMIHQLVGWDDVSEKPLWSVDLADAPAPSGEARTRHDVVTIQDGSVFVCTHSGVIAAIDLTTGRPAWAMRYPPAKVIKPPVAAAANHREIAPPVVSDGRVYVAPVDGDSLYALDQVSGRVLWTQPGIRVEQILGVSRGRLIVTLAGPVRGLRAFDPVTGSDAEPRGWRNHDDPGLASLGRGIATDEQILWPTRSGLFIIRPQDGLPARPPLRMPHGNLAYAQGTLIAANPNEVIGYVIPPVARQPRDEDPPEMRSPVFIGANRKENEARTAVQLKPAPASPRELLGPRVPKAVASTIPVPWSGAAWNDSTVHLLNDRSIATFDDTDQLTDPRPLGELARHLMTFSQFPGERQNLSDLPGREVRYPFDVPEISAWTRSRNTLIVRVGAHHLAAIDPDDLSLQWIVDASGRPRYWPVQFPAAVSWGRHLLIRGETLIASRSDGHAVILDVKTGTRIDTIPTTESEWPTPPALDEDMMFIASAPGRIAAYQGSRDRPIWEYQAEFEANLAGAAPGVWATRRVVLAAIARNHAMELHGIERETGQGLWLRPVTISGSRLTMAGIDRRQSIAFLFSDTRLLALRLLDGRILWQESLPESPAGWQATIADDGVILVPRAAIPRESNSEISRRLLRSLMDCPIPRRLPGLAFTWIENQFDRTIPLLAFDPETGRERLRLDLPAIGPTVAARFGPNRAIVATGGRAYLLK